MAVAITSYAPTFAYLGRQVVVTGTGFGASQGAGLVELTVAAGTTHQIAEQTIDAWADTEITFTVVFDDTVNAPIRAFPIQAVVVVTGDDATSDTLDGLLLVPTADALTYGDPATVMVGVHAGLGDGVVLADNPVGNGSIDWDDLTSYVRELEWDYGRTHELDRFEAGVAGFTLSNNDGRFDPMDTASPYYPNLVPLRPIRIVAAYVPTADEEDWIFRTMWQGYVDGWPSTFDGSGDAVSYIEATDLFKVMSLTSFTITSFNDLVKAKDPVAYWRFHLTNFVDDSSGNSHTLTFPNGETSSQPGVWSSDSAVTLNGTDEYATVASEAALELFADMSIECWFKPDDDAGDPQALISCRGSGVDAPLYDLFYFPDSEKVLFYPGSNSGSFVGAPDDSIPVGEWSHVVVTIDWVGSSGRTIIVYVNGVPLTQSFVAFQPGALTRAVNVGRRATNGDRYFDGSISELAVYDSVLTAAEVSQHYSTRGSAFASQRTDERIQAVIDNLGFDWTVLTAGQTTMAEGEQDTDALNMIRRAADTEFGSFYIEYGIIIFADRHWRLENASSPTATFGPSGLPYHEITPAVDDSNIRNIIEIQTGDGGAGETTATVRDEASITKYGERFYRRTTYPEDRNEALDAAYHVASIYAEPTLRVDRMKIKMGGTEALWPVVLAAGLNDRYTIIKTRPGDDIDVDVHLERVRHRIRGDKRWEVEWGLSPASDASFWILGDATLSLLGDTTTLGF